MSFFDVTQREERTKFRKTEFLYFDIGQHIVRILDAPLKVYTHYLPAMRITVKCLGEECPVCHNNRKIFLENPKNYRDIPGYNSRSPRHLFNVLDRTLVKTCPKCQFEVKRGGDFQFPSACPKCSTFVTDYTPHPSDKVKVASVSDTVASQINMFEQSMLDASGDPLPVTSYDFMFLVTKMDRKVTVPSPLIQNNDVVNVPEDAKFDLEKATLKLEADEINELLRGVSLRDIFAARRVDSAVEEKLDEETKELESDIEKRVSELFND